MTLRPDAILLVDWLNLSINLKNQRLVFGADCVSGLIGIAEKQADEYGNLRLARACFVSENFPSSTEAAIKRSLISEVHRTRTAKEQADLHLAVLAMDHLHDSSGCPRLFLLATGDQDFVPLIQRIVVEGAQVVLLVASLDRLAPEYRAIAAQRNVKLLSITELIDFSFLPKASGEKTGAAVLGLLRVCMSGGILGGAQERNAQLLGSWGLLTPGGDPEVEMEGLRQQFAKEEHRRVAVPGTGPRGNHAANRKRTFLNFEKPDVAEIVGDADWVLRRIGNKEMDTGALGVGRFGDDDGTRLDRILLSLKAVDWVTERSDGKFEAKLKWASDGLLEPLWRVVCEINRRTYEERTEGVERDRLFQDLRSLPIAYEGARRGGQAANEVIALARRLGVIDAVVAGTDGYALKVIKNHPVAGQVDVFVRSLAQLMGARIGTFVPRYEILRLMGEMDDKSHQPVFGFDVRDRQCVLRVLRRAKLIDERRDGSDTMLKLKWSAWLRSIVGRAAA